MHKNTYFLVARNLENNDFHIISESSLDSSLERIDLYTASFQKEENFTKFLLKEKKLSYDNIDYFIAYSKKQNAKMVLKTNEVLFTNSLFLKELGKSSLEGKIDKDKADSLLNLFCSKMEKEQSFYDMVLFGETDLYPKFVNYFLESRFTSSTSLKYKHGGWVTKSYPLLRNVVATIQSFENYSLEKNLENNYYRSLLEEDLLTLMNEEESSQPSFFTLLEKENRREEEKNYGYQR